MAQRESTDRAGVKLSRERIALHVLGSLLQRSEVDPTKVDENDMRWAFKIAEMFERVSEEAGGIPQRMAGRSKPDFWDDER